MIEIIERALREHGPVGGLEAESLKYTIDRASIKKESRVLSLDMTLNFVMPLEVCDKIKDELANKMDGRLKGVEINFSYSGMALEKTEAIKLFIPHMIEIVNGEYSSITKTIHTDRISLSGRELIIYALGDFAVEKLNETVKKKFEHLLKDCLSIEADIHFENDQELYLDKVKALKEGEEEEIKASVEEYAAGSVLFEKLESLLGYL